MTTTALGILGVIAGIAIGGLLASYRSDDPRNPWPLAGVTMVALVCMVVVVLIGL